MFLLPNWKRILRKAWSIRLILLAGFFTALEFTLPYLPAFAIVPDRIFAGLAFIITMAALVARLVAQKDIENG